MAFDQEQVQNAALIYRVGQQMGMSTRDIQIALITAMVESDLRNVHYGDRDSLGLFQQRPSQGWGTTEQVLDPTYASRKFYSALRGLGDRRNQMNMGAAAQAVQRSAYPGRYAQQIAPMRDLWPRIATAAGQPQTDMDGNPYGAQGQPNQPAIPEQQMPTPSIEDMLGAWENYTPQQADTGQIESPAPQIGPHTNETIIKPLMQKAGATPGVAYEKGVDGWRKAVVEISQRYLGTPYVWGGTSPDGFDCSGFVQYVMNKVGKNLPRVSYQQASYGQRVALNKLQPGDLVAWDNSSRNAGADHIAIYIGGGKIIEEPRPGLSVRIRTLGSNEGAWGVSLG